LTNADVAGLLLRIADLVELQGDNPFKVRAYREAARQIADLVAPVQETWRQGRLREVPGVGAAIATKVAEYLETGHLTFLERLEEAVPPALLTLREIPGLGPRKAKEIYDALGITTVEELEAAARAQRLRALPGIKAKTEENLLEGIEIWRRRHGRRLLLGEALPLATAMLERLRALPQVLQAEAAGSVRRRAATIGDLDLLITSADPAPVIDAFIHGPEVAQVLAAGPTKASIRTPPGLQADLRVVEAASFGAALQYFTGSQAHNVQLRGHAERRGLKVNEYGVFANDSGERVAGETEEGVYAAVGLPWIPPELREGRGELPAAARGELAAYALGVAPGV
jgi:DNA polymerase (family 10)